MLRRLLVIGALILAGEAIFALPFHVPRFFRAPVLDVFGLSNADLGDVFAVYGIAAMLAYFPGGAIADRFAPRRLMAFSLAATAAGGLYLATIPDVAGLSVLFAYWGVTTILLFWAAMIRATREWGGDSSQGRAFGLLDGGRGLVAAGFASVAVAIFSALLPDANAAREPALVRVIYCYTALTAFAAFVTYVVIPDGGPPAARHSARMTAHMGAVLKDRIVWAQALIVVCAYCGYKGLDNVALYAVEVLGMSDVDAARFTATCAYLRPVGAIAAGLLADRTRTSAVVVVLFATLVVTHAWLGLASPIPGAVDALVFANIIVGFAAVFGLRGVYFALLGETQTPNEVTGTAVGLISLVGYTPDVFFAAIGGRLLDASPGITGHQHYFLFLTAIMAVGLTATAVLVVLTRRRSAARATAPVQALSSEGSGV